VRESKVVGSTTLQFTWDGASGNLLQQYDGTTKTSFIYGPGGLPVEQIAGSTTTYLHHDHIGSTRLITDSAGATGTATTITYDPYGNSVTTSGSLTSPLGFTGVYADGETGLLAATHRYYDPTTAQFLTRDPAVAKTRSPYAYVSGNPLNKTDPSGLYATGCDAQGNTIDNGQAGPSLISCHTATSFSQIKDGPGIPLTSEWLTVSWTDTGGTASDIHSSMITQGHDGGFMFGHWDVTGQNLTQSGCTITGTSQFVNQGFGFFSSPGFYINQLQASITIGSFGSWSSSSSAWGNNSFVNTFNAHGGAWSGGPSAGPSDERP
jgi:RHS repeat-associated protein